MASNQIIEVDATFIGEDGLDNRLASTWKTRDKALKARKLANAKVYTAKLKALKQIA